MIADPVRRRLIFEFDSESGSESESAFEPVQKNLITVKQFSESPN